MSGKIPKERERYFVRLDSGEVCEVSREVYLCYYAGERQERYQRERDIKNGLVSIEAMAETMFDDGEGCGYDFIPSDEIGVAEQGEDHKGQKRHIQDDLKDPKPLGDRFIISVPDSREHLFPGLFFEKPFQFTPPLRLLDKFYSIAPSR